MPIADTCYLEDIVYAVVIRREERRNDYWITILEALDYHLGCILVVAQSASCHSHYEILAFLYLINVHLSLLAILWSIVCQHKVSLVDVWITRNFLSTKYSDD